MVKIWAKRMTSTVPLYFPRGAHESELLETRVRKKCKGLIWAAHLHGAAKFPGAHAQVHDGVKHLVIGCAAALEEVLQHP